MEFHLINHQIHQHHGLRSGQVWVMAHRAADIPQSSAIIFHQLYIMFNLRWFRPSRELLFLHSLSSQPAALFRTYCTSIEVRAQSTAIFPIRWSSKRLKHRAAVVEHCVRLNETSTKYPSHSFPNSGSGLQASAWSQSALQN